MHGLAHFVSAYRSFRSAFGYRTTQVSAAASKSAFHPDRLPFCRAFHSLAITRSALIQSDVHYMIERINRGEKKRKKERRKEKEGDDFSQFDHLSIFNFQALIIYFDIVDR